MLSGLKFLPRDQIEKDNDETLDGSKEGRQKLGNRKKKGGRKKKKAHYSSSSDEDLSKIKSGSRKKKKWYASDEDVSSYSEGSGSQSELERDRKKHKSRKRENKTYDESLEKEQILLKKKSRTSKKGYSSEDESQDSEKERHGGKRRHHKGGNIRLKEDEKGVTNDDTMDGNFDADENRGSQSQNSNNVVRKDMGLEWMLRPKENKEKTSNKGFDIQPEEVPTEKMERDNSRELNPYLKDNGVGYPDEPEGMKSAGKQFLSTAVIGDGGASWRLKALKRAKEQATREGRKLQEVVEERWGSMGHLAASVASRNVAPTHAHLHAINSRRKGMIKDERTNVGKDVDSAEKGSDQKSVKDITPRHSKMRMPKLDDSLSWGKRGKKQLTTEDTALVSAAISSLNKFSNDGSFIDEFIHPKKDNSGNPSNSSHENFEGRAEPNLAGYASLETKEDAGTVKPVMGANQLAAKALQLRMKGKHEEAEKLLKEAQMNKVRQDPGNESSRPRIDGTTSRFIMHDVSVRQNKKEEDGDLHLAQKIMHNHKYSISTQADEEYDYDDGPRRKARKKGEGSNQRSSEINNSANRILTQQERCQFCFENPTRPKHLVVAIANFSYMALPQRQPVAPGHCCIVTLQHESSTRTVDQNVWDEIRNFKKCLIMMFGKQEKEVVFLETVMGLAQQRRHCIVECIPLPRQMAKQAPVYFKKAIDEAEDEWSQHNAKKLIDTSEKGLRGSIPKNFPYFHVEFGLNKGFVHVIDDEKEFKSDFGLNVIRGILRLPAEDMNRRQRHESVESQRQAVANFARDWEPFDWTKQLA